MVPRLRACNHADPTNWLDVGTDSRGHIKTICRVCSGIIGYRKPPEEKLAKTEKLQSAAVVANAATSDASESDSSFWGPSDDSESRPNYD